ncbi:MAG: hypothetical protein HOK06_06870 [Rhodospirillaceae bacterium]|jgi:hypothetical protein|nr:hypothetical protein [Rhodospirillaceae bacterium]MBT4219389.1 hypothetical protein [Rhodospirillaceae bacterium]MBT4464301.1 hypothetical protein [Rhodospirillaceae bacterium]MBT5308698.1 hypothetical protein [Rhodospirillaceae bacterium]MBT6407309.1 hypothetical protein [Rhodospirillaceae bacterium]
MASAAAPSKDDAPSPESLRAALKALDDIGRSGLAVVPLEPTAAMVTAGLRVGGISETQVMGIYFAMLSAAADDN